MDVVYDVDYHTRPNGDIPTLEAFACFEVVSPKLRDAVLAGVERLGTRNHHTGKLVQQAEPGLWYMRIHTGSNFARLFFVFTKGAKIYLLNGFVKKTDRIPQAELNKARVLAREVRAYA